MKLRLFIFVLLSCSGTLNAQVAISYFPFESLLSVSSNTEKLLWVDYKLATNSFFSNLNMEISPKINIKRSEWVNYYTGIGIAFNPVNAFSDLAVTNGYFLDFGARIKPLAKCRNVQVIFELSPYINKSFKSGNLRSRLGVAWNFNKKRAGVAK